MRLRQQSRRVLSYHVRRLITGIVVVWLVIVRAADFAAITGSCCAWQRQSRTIIQG